MKLYFFDPKKGYLHCILIFAENEEEAWDLVKQHHSYVNREEWTVNEKEIVKGFVEIFIE